MGKRNDNATLTFLGTAFSLAASRHDHTHLLLRGRTSTILVDAPSPTVHRLQKVGCSPLALDAILLTHFHPDHISGIWLLLMDLWLLGRKTALPILGPAHCIQRVQTVLDLFDPHTWEGMYPLEFRALPETPGIAVWEDDDFVIDATPVEHFIPVFAYRIGNKHNGKVLVYSADTQPCENLRQLASGADWLIHEATGAGLGHTSPAQAGEIAASAGVSQLALVHYDVIQRTRADIQAEAQATFGKEVLVPQDFSHIAF